MPVLLILFTFHLFELRTALPEELEWSVIAGLQELQTDHFHPQNELRPQCGVLNLNVIRGCGDEPLKIAW